MSISERNYDSRLSFGNKMNPLVILIAISMIIFVVLAFFKALTYIRYPEGSDIQTIFEKNVLSWFVLSPAATVAFTKFWTFFTHAFVHISFWDLFANMLWLWCFGFIFIDLTGNRKLIPVFLYGVMAGAAGYLITSSFIPANQLLTNTQYFFGCGAGILGICAAAVTINPNYKLFPMLGGGISLWIIGVIYLAINMATIPASNLPVHIAHLAGALSGFLFVYILRKGYDGSDWMNHLYDWFMNLFNPETKVQHRAVIKSTRFYKSDTLPFTKTTKLTQKRLDEILDKINTTGGYDKLTEEEKDFLKKASSEDFKQ
ncbi:MAG: rhomboid family intramembrane serine protease [Niabella sp.]